MSKLDVDPKKPCSDVSSTLYACTVQDAVLPSRSYQDLCVYFLHKIHRQKENRLSFAQNFDLPVSILN